MKKRILSAISIVLMGTLMVFVSCKEEQKNPPLIKDVEVTGDGPFIVKATILDDNGALKSAELFYKKSTETTFTTVNMVKGDANVYSAEIPAQDPTTVINYYIKAVNSVDLITLNLQGLLKPPFSLKLEALITKALFLTKFGQVLHPMKKNSSSCSIKPTKTLIFQAYFLNVTVMPVTVLWEPYPTIQL